MMTRGGEGGKKCPKFDDVICERPLKSKFKSHETKALLYVHRNTRFVLNLQKSLHFRIISCTRIKKNLFKNLKSTNITVTFD